MFDGARFNPSHLAEALSFVQSLSGQVKAVAFIREARNAGAFIALSFGHVYASTNVVLRSDLSWPMGMRDQWGGHPVDFEHVVESAANLSGRSAILFRAILDRWIPLSYQSGTEGMIAWRMDLQGDVVLAREAQELRISGDIGLRTGLIDDVVTDEHDLAKAILPTQSPEIVEIGDEVTANWRGRVASADRIVWETWSRYKEVYEEIRESSYPVDAASVERLQAETEVLLYWSQELGALRGHYGLDGTHLALTLDVVKETLKHPSWLTETEWRKVRLRLSAKDHHGEENGSGTLNGEHRTP
jgi:hypothetical protein